jgi:hypothetical protein
MMAFDSILKSTVKEKYSGTGLDAVEFASQIDGKFMSAFVLATKPLGQCCGPDCC